MPEVSSVCIAFSEDHFILIGITWFVFGSTLPSIRNERLLETYFRFSSFICRCTINALVQTYFISYSLTPYTLHYGSAKPQTANEILIFIGN